MNNVPDPSLAGKELPTFKFALEKSDGKVIGGSYGKEATVDATADLQGHRRRLDAARARRDARAALARHRRRVGLRPRGPRPHHRHRPAGLRRDQRLRPRRRLVLSRAATATCSQCLGDKPCHFILIFDNGYFSEFGTFSITDWIGHAPKALLAKNFGLPEVGVRRLSRRRRSTSPAARSPPDEAAAAAAGLEAAAADAQVPAAGPAAALRSIKGGREWRVDSTRFPISKTITGVVLDLEPGALRELHWHPNADEWQYVIEGEVSVTLFGSHGRYRTETLEKGDVGYIPQGYGHSIENVGSGPARILIGFNTGVYETIDLSQWIAGNPDDVLATNFGQPAEAFGKFPDRDVFIAGKDGA